MATEPSARSDIRAGRGASAVEYAILISAVAAVIAAAVLLFGGGVTDLFQQSCDEVASAQSQTCS